MKWPAIGAVILALLSFGVSAPAQQSPHVAYVYPAGGRAGSSFELTVGGQFLVAVSNVCFSGDGIAAQVIERNKPMPQKEFNELREELKQLRDKQQSNWTALSQQRIAEIRNKILKNPPNRQSNPAMAETAVVKITIATNAEPGECEIRLRAPNSISNPLRFYVSALPEYSKPPIKAPNPELDKFLERLGRKPAEPTPVTDSHIILPAVVNGQTPAGGRDRFRFFAQRGQHLVICVGARALIPYLADAVPGWFEATATLYDSKGHELAYADRFRYRPDPVLHYEITNNGEYCVEIRDSIFRGREDFVYRMTIGELPFVTDIFPLGGRAGEKTVVHLTGWNLPKTKMSLDNRGKSPGLETIFLGTNYVGPVLFPLDTLPECQATGANSTAIGAQWVTLPIIINGRIEAPDSEAWYKFTGRAGEQIAAEIMARRLGSPLDSTLELTDAAGKQIAFNDDFDDACAGLETHHADSYLTAALPADGTYFARVRDAQHQGGPEFAYRLRLSEARPDFSLRVSPSSLNVRGGLSAPLTACVARKDGLTNAIEIRLRNAPPGFVLTGARITAGQDKVQFTLKAPSNLSSNLFSLEFEGRAIAAARPIVRSALPAEDMMQAFFYRHLVPSKEMAVLVIPNSRSMASGMLKVLDSLPVKIPLGGSARVRISTPSDAFASRFNILLNNAPAGISITNVQTTDTGVEIALCCDGASAEKGAAGNLIFSLQPKRTARAGQKKPNPSQANATVGSLPAVPYEIVAAAR